MNITAAGLYLLKTGTYAGFTVGATVDAGVMIHVEDNTIITSDITLDGDNTTIEAGSCFDLDTNSADIILNGANCSVFVENGGALHKISGTGNKCSFDGRGKDTLIDSGTDAWAVRITGTHFLVGNCQGTTANQAGSRPPFHLNEKGVAYNCHVPTGDDGGYELSGTNVKVLNSYYLTGTGSAFSIIIHGAGGIAYECNVTGHAWRINAADCIITNSLSRVGTGTLTASAVDSIMSACRLLNAPTDSGTGNVVSNHKVGAF